MSTRSLIGIYREEEKMVEYIYCHFDGYLDGVGKLLEEHYQTQDKIERLIAGGDISYLGKDLPNEQLLQFIEVAKQDVDCAKMITELVYKKFSKMDITCSYNVWRNEGTTSSKCTPQQFTNEDERMAGEEFRYMWNGTCWLVTLK